MLNYLKVTNLQVGLLINFTHPKLEFKCVVRIMIQAESFFTTDERRWTQILGRVVWGWSSSVFICVHLWFALTAFACFPTS